MELIHQQTALLARNLVETNDPEYRRLGNIQLTGLMSAETFTNQTEEEVLAALRARGRHPYFIPSGASTHPLGGLGFARWAFELEEQEHTMGVFFDTIILALASGSTLGEMLAGFKYAAQQKKTSSQTTGKRRIIGIQATTIPKEELKALVMKIAETAAIKIGLDTTGLSWKDDFEIESRFTAGAYGQVDEATTAAIKEFASLQGILTDPVYTGKAITGVINMARMEELRRSKNVLFVHTGGQASLSAYPSLC
jgi:1-aminocyclopropane-1-carboxylate deaminase